ncbi:MAG: YbbR-like domain-containing protein [Proteobacteria bacterium]|nr:YbbR-like domain-containing protein [Pseudomonadota bacterium]MBU1585816.1 YbbR-like domain-containing protein [Pseudomonadota bacterium]MBU2452220.1 YbbR-like domain-containing protein [Pseudomonadota bacterium]MBU2631050.1 YbbR-like domain-containing protein [Pseudomonadota bacterium]
MRKLKVYSKPLILFIFLIGFWFSGCTSEPVETELLLFVDFSNVPENMVLTNFHTDKIEIKIQADPKLIDRIKKENTRYPVDLYTDLEFDPAGDSDSIEPGAYLIPVEQKRIPMDPAIKILSINPSYLSVQLEKKIKKTFQITVPYIGTPAKGYIALEAATEPASMELVGAAPLIESIHELKTKPIDLTNANENFKKKIPLDLDNPSIISSLDPIIIVTVPVQQLLVSKTIENIPIQVWNSSSRVSIEPSQITIQVKGPFETLSNKEITDQIYSFIDLKGLGPGVYARHAYINIPVALMMTDAVPQVFTVKIE